jgi:hypothetical protein
MRLPTAGFCRMGFGIFCSLPALTWDYAYYLHGYWIAVLESAKIQLFYF